MTNQPPTSPYDSGILDATERAPQFDLAPTVTADMRSSLKRAAESAPDIGHAGARMIAEVVTIANMGRHAQEKPVMSDDDLTLTMRFFEWLFDGLVRR